MEKFLKESVLSLGVIYHSEISKHFVLFPSHAWKDMINTITLCPHVVSPHRENRFFMTNERYLVWFFKSPPVPSTVDSRWLLLFSRSVVSNSLPPHGLQHIRLPCPSLSPRVCPTCVHWFGNAIQPSHSVSPSSPPALSLSQHWGPFKWVCSSYQVAKVLELELQHQSFQWIFRTDFL